MVLDRRRRRHRWRRCYRVTVTWPSHDDRGRLAGAVDLQRRPPIPSSRYTTIWAYVPRRMAARCCRSTKARNQRLRPWGAGHFRTRRGVRTMVWFNVAPRTSWPVRWIGRHLKARPSGRSSWRTRAWTAVIRFWRNSSNRPPLATPSAERCRRDRRQSPRRSPPTDRRCTRTRARTARKYDTMGIVRNEGDWSWCATTGRARPHLQ